MDSALLRPIPKGMDAEGLRVYGDGRGPLGDATKPSIMPLGAPLAPGCRVSLADVATRWRAWSWVAHQVLDGGQQNYEAGPPRPIFFFEWEMPRYARNPSRAYRMITIGRLRGWADRPNTATWPVLPGLAAIDPYRGHGPLDRRLLPDGSPLAEALATAVLLDLIESKEGT